MAFLRSDRNEDRVPALGRPRLGFGRTRPTTGPLKSKAGRHSGGSLLTSFVLFVATVIVATLVVASLPGSQPTERAVPAPSVAAAQPVSVAVEAPAAAREAPRSIAIRAPPSNRPATAASDLSVGSRNDPTPAPRRAARAPPAAGSAEPAPGDNSPYSLSQLPVLEEGGSSFGADYEERPRPSGRR